MKYEFFKYSFEDYAKTLFSWLSDGLDCFYCLHSKHRTWFLNWILNPQKGAYLYCLVSQLFSIHLWEGPASQPHSTISCWKNLPPLIKNSDPPNLGPKKKHIDHSFQNCFDIWCQNCMVWSSGGYLCPETAKKCNFWV